MTDPNAEFAAVRRAELLAAAAAHRAAHPAPRTPWALRVYARLWWGLRPRAAAWTPGLFDVPAH